ncbi:MAG: LacI family transcriptional regulator [Cyclobacteriaceae bacterium]|nr:LacI family DNA-binding transcriptional regulator [Cyclobacteriaceae bacterium]MCH8517411.1 LacI family transcriptional regulator [Cyclobacteriaceae bacterium]
MLPGQVTIKDIARELNISPSTVSRALKDHPDISPKTKKAVVALAKELNYQPNTIASALRSSKTNTIGVMIPQIVHHFFSSTISGIEDAAREQGYNILICQSNEKYDREVANAGILYSSRVDGFLISISSETNDYSHFESLYERGVPMVFFDRVCPSLPTGKVVVDDFEGAKNATKHLIDQKFTKILHVSGPEKLSISKNREDGYADAMKDGGLENEIRIIRSELSVEGGMKIADEILKLPHLPEAIFAVTDPVALGIHKRFSERGVKIPSQVALIGFSNEPVTQLVSPSISTVEQPGYEMGKKAAEMLIEQLKSKDKENFKVMEYTLPTNLIIRDSSIKTV